ncbi:MAG: chloride channel protein [Candidatus Binataceae bacterium]|nr:chloride channel protein [Candidatus Binataceae bacterium]
MNDELNGPRPGVTAPPKPLVPAEALALRDDQLEYLELILMAVAVGALAALGNLGFRKLIEFFSWVFRGLLWNALAIRQGSWTMILIPIVLLAGGAGILMLNYIFPGDVLGYGFPNFLEMVNLGNARIKRRWIVVKALGAALSLGAGASVGREGPIAQIGGAIGSAVAQARRLSVDRAKVLVAAGAGAGIATTFNAPMGGLMFAQEIVLMGETELTNLVLVIVATFTAVVTSRTIMGESGAVFHPVVFEIKSYWEMLGYGLMGGMLGLMGAGYIRFFHATGRYFRALKLPPWAKLAAGLAVVGVIAIVLPQNLSDGYPEIDRAITGQLGLDILAGLAVAKFVASAISLDCGAPGGVFGPIFFMGAMAGGAFRQTVHWFAPGMVGPRGSYSLIGLGAFLGGVTHAPLTALFLLFEMTQLNYSVALPAMIATITALVVARSIESESIDTYSLAREGKTLAIGKERMVLTQLPVASVMHKNVDILTENASLHDVLRVAGETSQATLPVVDSEGQLAGLVVTRDLLALLAGGTELGPLVNAYDICRRNPPVVMPESNLDQAAQLMEYEALDELPVVAGPHGGHFLGLVSRRNVAQAFNRVTVSLSAMDTGDRGIFWATGYRVTRLRIPAGAGGQTIRQIDPRARFSVSVLAIQDGSDPTSGFAPITPDRALRPGDLIVAAGRPADLRRFTRALEMVGDPPPT